MPLQLVDLVRYNDDTPLLPKTFILTTKIPTNKARQCYLLNKEDVQEACGSGQKWILGN